MSGSKDPDAKNIPEHRGGYASPPCMMHELDPTYSGLSEAEAVDPQQRRDVMRWRKAERQRLIQERLALPGKKRLAQGGSIAERLLAELGDPTGLVVSAYWPFRGEPDLRGLLKQVIAAGGQAALPVVIEKGQPLIFRAWRPKDPLERGVWNIPIPQAGAPEVVPDVVISPVVGFDPRCFRLGYGGGFFDRTLAAMPEKPRVFGVGYSIAAIPTIFPQPHDIPMDCIITEEATHHPQK